MGALFERFRLGLVLPFAGLIVGVLVHGLYWAVVAGGLDQRAEAWIAVQERAGYEIEHQGLSVGGYPFRFSLRVDAPVIGAPASDGGWRAEFERLAATAQFYNLDHWIVTLGAPARLSTQVAGEAAVYLLNADLARVSLAATSGATTRVGADLDGFTLTVESGPAAVVERVGQVRLSGFLDEQDRLSFALEALDVRLADSQMEPEIVEAFGSTAQRVRLSGALTHWSTLARAVDPYVWTGSGGRLEIAAAQLVWGPADINGSGEITLDTLMRPTGRLSLVVTDPDTLIGALEAAGLVYDEQGQALRLFALMAPRRDTGIALPFRLQDGGLFLGPARIGSVGAVN
jgi:hypothetical protein